MRSEKRQVRNKNRELGHEKKIRWDKREVRIRIEKRKAKRGQ